MESVADLRDSLRQRGLDLIVRQGKPEDIVPSIAKSIGAHTVMPLFLSCKLRFSSSSFSSESKAGSWVAAFISSEASCIGLK